MNSLQKHYCHLKESIAQANAAVSLLAVSKKASQEQIKQWFDCGQQAFGENRLDHLQAMAAAFAGYPIEWHFIGHLQRKKVRAVIEICDWVDSVDSIKLLDKLQLEAAKLNKTLNILIQLNISGELQKTGLPLSQLDKVVQHALTCANIQLRGLMCMAPFYDNKEQSRPIFETCYKQFLRVKLQYNLGEAFSVVSMGMSNDYQTAIECGATQIRLGSALYV